MLTPLELVCQYQVTPLGGLVRVNVLFPQLFVEIDGVEGVPGITPTVTFIDLLELQQPAPFRALM